MRSDHSITELTRSWLHVVVLFVIFELCISNSGFVSVNSGWSLVNSGHYKFFDILYQVQESFY